MLRQYGSSSTRGIKSRPKPPLSQNSDIRDDQRHRLIVREQE
jgi:hypothetical protein